MRCPIIIAGNFCSIHIFNRYIRYFNQRARGAISDNLSIEEIAQITGARSAAIKKQLSRGREMLRCILKEDLIHE